MGVEASFSYGVTMDWITSLVNWLFGYKDQSKLIAQIQASTVKLCGFLPYAGTVAQLLSANPAVAVANTIATKICQAVSSSRSTATLLGDAKPLPEVDGVIIEGEFVDPKKEGK